MAREGTLGFPHILIRNECDLWEEKDKTYFGLMTIFALKSNPHEDPVDGIKTNQAYILPREYIGKRKYAIDEDDFHKKLTWLSRRKYIKFRKHRKGYLLEILDERVVVSSHKRILEIETAEKEAR